jgi:sugar O-acyltransferase (sialic acid O-acetyltransferase NeuD family)
MKDLHILGAGGFGRELLNLILDIHAISGPRWNIKGFLDDTEDPLRGKACDYPVVGTIEGYTPKENEALVMGIANPAAKERLSTLLKARGAVFETVVHPYAYLGRHNTLGEGAVIGGGFSMTVNVSIGNFPTLLACDLGHDVTVGDYCTISSCCNLMGRVSIGRRVFIGSHVAVAPSAVIEDDAYVGVGSVVLKRVKAGEKVFGNPAREIGI